MATLGSKREALFGQSEDQVTVAWRAAVQAAGGTVTPGYSAALTRFIRTLRAAGVLACLDDIGMFRCENSTQATVSLLQRRAGTNNGAVFVPFSGWSCNGSSTYFNTGFIPSTHCTVAALTDQMFGTWENQNLALATYSIGGGGIGGGNAGSGWLIPRTGGGIVQTHMSSGNINGPTVSDSRNLTATDRDGTTVYFYKDGVQTGTAAIDTTDGLPNGALYIGCRNNAGSAQNFRANTFSMWVFGRLLTQAQHLSFYNALVAFFAAIRAPDIYVDDATGADTNPGTESLPVKTADRAMTISIRRARNLFAGSAGSPTTYTLSAQVVKQVTLAALEPLGALMQGTSGTQALVHNPTGGELLTIEDFILDPSGNSGGAGQIGVQLSAQSVAFGLLMRRCLVRNWTSLHGLIGSTNARVNTTLLDTDFTSNPAISCNSAVVFGSLLAGNISIERGTSTLAKVVGGGNGGLMFTAAAAGIGLRVIDHTLVITPESAASGSLYGIRAKGIASALIQGGSYTVNGGGSTVVGFSCGVALDSGTLPISNSQIIGVTAYNDAPGGGLGIFANLDQASQDTTKADNILISGCSFTGGSNFTAANGHGIFLCFTQNSLGTLNYSETSAYNYLLKATIDSWHTDSTGKNATVANALVKGAAGGGYEGCTFIAESGWAPTAMLDIEANGAVDSTDIEITGNTFVVDGATNVKFVVVGSGQGATFSGNTYRVDSGSAAALPFTWLGVAVSKAYWLATVEPDATCIGF